MCKITLKITNSWTPCKELTEGLNVLALGQLADKISLQQELIMMNLLSKTCTASAINWLETVMVNKDSYIISIN